MKTHSLLEQVIRKMILEQPATSTGILKQKPKTIKSKNDQPRAEIVHITVEPGSERAVRQGWENGVVDIETAAGGERSTFEVRVVMNHKINDIDFTIPDDPKIYKMISMSPAYGVTSVYNKATSPDTPSGKKYAYVIGNNVSHLPKRGKFNVWVINLELLYKIANQIDAILGIDDSYAVTEINNIHPLKSSDSFVPLYTIKRFGKLVGTIKAYMQDPAIKDKIRLPEFGSTYDKSSNTISISNEKIFPNLTKLDKNYTEDQEKQDLVVNTTPKEVEIEDGSGSVTGFLNFVGTGKSTTSGTGTQKFIPIKGSMNIYRSNNSEVGLFDGTFEKGWPASGTITWPNETPYEVNDIPLASLKKIYVPDPDSTGSDNAATIISFKLKTKKESKTKNAQTTAVSNISPEELTTNKIQYPYIWDNSHGKFTVITIPKYSDASKPDADLIFYKDESTVFTPVWYFIKRSVFEAAVNSPEIVNLNPEKIFDKGLIKELNLALLAAESGVPSIQPINNPEEVKPKAEPEVKKTNPVVTPKPKPITKTQIYLVNASQVGVNIQRFTKNGDVFTKNGGLYKTTSADKFYKTATANKKDAGGKVYKLVQFSNGKNYWVYASAFKK